MTQTGRNVQVSPISLTPEEARKVLLAAQGAYPNLTQAKEIARKMMEQDSAITSVQFKIDIYHGNTMDVSIDRNLDAWEVPCSQ